MMWSGVVLVSGRSRLPSTVNRHWCGAGFKIFGADVIILVITAPQS